MTAFAVGEKRIWDNSNIVESYPGITLPLTYSFISRAYRAVYWQFCQVLGLPEGEIARHDDMLSNMLGHIRGRVYYNLLNWYRMVSLLPGFRFNKEFMEGMMGVSRPEELEAPPLTWREKYFREFPRLVRVGLRCLYLQVTLERRIAHFHRTFAAAHRTFAAVDYDGLEPAEVLKRYDAMEKEVLWKWKAPIINDFSAMIFYGLLARLTRSWRVDADGTLHNALVSRQGGIESTEVATGLQRLAALISADKELAAAMREAAPAEALELIRGDEDAAGEFEVYLDAFGDRTLAELKLESKSMREDPSFCIAMLQNYLRGSAGDAAGFRGDDRERERAERQVADRLKGKLTRFGLPRHFLYRRVLKGTRAAIRNRENQRLARTRAFAVVRRMFRAMGGTWARRGFLHNGRDVFYLTLEDLRRAVADEGSLAGLASLVKERKARYEAFRAGPPPPEHFVTYGEMDDDAPLAAGDETPSVSDGLTGLGACPGVVEGEALVLHEPDTTVRVDGQILVAPLTDPGWVLLFPSISGLVVERGSMLSHSAIVAREMGIPAVVGVKGATAAIASGDRIRIDGGRGTVERR